MSIAAGGQGRGQPAPAFADTTTDTRPGKPEAATGPRGERGDRAASALADGLAEQVQRWSARLGADAAAQRAASRAAWAVSQALRDGHVCVELAELLDATGPTRQAAAEDLRAALLRSQVVGSPEQQPGPGGSCPLVLDADGRLYLQRSFDHEWRLARRLWVALQAPATEPAPAAVKALQSLLGAESGTTPAQPPAGSDARAEVKPDAEPDQQRQAVLQALRGRLTVISGGPGTGKTTTVVALMACLAQQQPGCRLALVAPTGKAAARLGDAILQRTAAWPPHWRQGLPTEASTVHRLLGTDPATGRFFHHARRLLPIDVLIVDEASMLDLALARRLLDAVPPDARIVMLGDKDQLAAVESGAVFAELSSRHARDPDATASAAASPAAASPAADSTGLAQASVHLTRNFRFASGSGIASLATRIRAGHADDVLQQLRHWPHDPPSPDAGAGGQAGVRGIADADPMLLPSTRLALQAHWLAYIEALRTHMHDVSAVLLAFDRYRLLAAQQSGARGVRALNEWISRHVWAALHRGPAGEAREARETASDAAPPAWYAGRPVMLLRNDPSLGLFNGDVGIALPVPGAAMHEPAANADLRVWFAQAGGGARPLAPSRLPEHQTAFAMTVHKSQGSEFDAVAVVLPAAPHRIVSRELLYTAVTRARSAVTVVGSDDVLTAACLAPTHRRSGLLARLAALQR